jgi:hypothetical protein
VKRALLFAVAVSSLGWALGCAHHAPAADVEARLAKLEAIFAQHREALEFLDKAYAEVKKQDDNVLADDGVWAVDVDAAIAAHQTEGPRDALVTIVEAWDFG